LIAGGTWPDAMIGPPMPIPRRAAARLRLVRTPLLLVLVATMSACGVEPHPSPSSAGTQAASASPVPTPSPSPTPAPTPSFTNPADPALAALIPKALLGHPVTIPTVKEFALTPGDIGQLYGEIGDRFRALQVAFIESPRLSLYAMRMDPPFATTADLEPYLAAAGEYVGIAGLHRDPWELKTIGHHLAWVRPGDGATLLGTMIYAWATGGYVFLMTGVNQAQNLAMLQALPGEAPPTPTPAPSRPPAGSGSPSASSS
jgi:hypothetical protein